jgi:hypothetical protein
VIGSAADPEKGWTAHMMCAYHEEMLVQQAGNGPGRSGPVLLPVALGALRIIR